MTRSLRNLLIVVLGLALGIGAHLYVTPVLLEFVLRTPPKITVRNVSTEIIKNVVVFGYGWSQPLPSLESRKEIFFVLENMKGESGLGIEFDTSAGHVKKNDLAYLEGRGGYYTTLTIRPDYNIDVETGIGRTFRFLNGE